MAKQKSIPIFVICVTNHWYPAALELRKVYRALNDQPAAAKDLVRIIDESGEDYLYPAMCFAATEVPQAAAGIFGEAS